jgi:pimeloyl-ACP methyl ester carboxylesterase
MSLRSSRWGFILAERILTKWSRIPREATGAIVRIDFTKARPPLLLVAGLADHIIPASLNRSNYEKYRPSPSVTQFREFPGREHFTSGQQGWEEVADGAATWLEK